jgi:hypothetical protein
MAGALLAVSLWSTFCSSLWAPLKFIHASFSDIIPGWIQFYLPSWFNESQMMYPLQIVFLFLRYISVMLVAVFLAKGRLKFSHTTLHFFGETRTRFFVAALGVFLLANSVNLWRSQAYFLFELIWFLPLIILTTWLIEPKKETATITP